MRIEETAVSFFARRSHCGIKSMEGLNFCHCFIFIPFFCVSYFWFLELFPSSVQRRRARSPESWLIEGAFVG